MQKDGLKCLLRGLSVALVAFCRLGSLASWNRGRVFLAWSRRLACSLDGLGRLRSNDDAFLTLRFEDNICDLLALFLAVLEFLDVALLDFSSARGGLISVVGEELLVTFLLLLGDLLVVGTIFGIQTLPHVSDDAADVAMIVLDLLGNKLL